MNLHGKGGSFAKGVRALCGRPAASSAVKQGCAAAAEPRAATAAAAVFATSNEFEQLWPNVGDPFHLISEPRSRAESWGKELLDGKKGVICGKPLKVHIISVLHC